MESLPVEHFSVDTAASKKADPKRASLQSGISEFSFEQNDDTTYANNQNSSPTERIPSPVKPTGRIEQLVKRNRELEKRTTDQNTLISALRSHIQILEKRLREHNIEVPPFLEPVILKDTVVRSLNLEPVNRSFDKLHLPPRSADRLRTSPLRSPVSQRAAPSRSQEILSQLNESTKSEIMISQHKSTEKLEEHDIDLNADYSHSDLNSPEEPSIHDKDEQIPEPPSPKSEILDLNADEVEEPVQQAISSPAPVKANVDWNATIQALKSSAHDSKGVGEEEKESLDDADYEEAAVETVETKVQMTPYSGRIASPSYTNSKDALSPVGSQFSASITTPYIDRSSHLSPTKNGSTSPMDNRSFQPVSPIRLQVQSNSIPSRSASQQSVQTPQSSVRSPVHTENMPLSKANIYDPYAVDFHQQAYIDYTQVSTPQQPSFPASPQDLRNRELPQPSTPTYPSDVPLFVDPAHLNTVKPEIISTIHGNPTKKSDDPFVSIAILDRQTNKEMWRFRKSLSQILMLDAEIRPMINSFSLPPVPEKSLFLTNAPVRVDSRRTRTKDYFATLFSIPDVPLDAAYKIARFMSLDVINLLDESNMDVMKEGWLLRRTKGLGSTWKARYCLIDGPFINVHDCPDGPVLEVIKLTGSQIGRQPDDLRTSDDKSAFRHAFAVLEPKKAIKSNSFTKHIFCAETDIERDLWVNVLVQLHDDGGSAQSIYSADSTTVSSMTTPKRDHTSPEAGSGFSPSKTLSSSASVDLDDQEQHEKEAKKQKKRSFFPFSKKQLAADNTDPFKQQQEVATSIMASSIEKSLQEMNLGTANINTSTIFQNELSTVLGLSSHTMFGLRVPSIVYRCLSYLIERSAIYEEGLFRLSGSSAMIKQLRHSFDTSHDVDFNQLETRPDINTVAGLLKLWLRELPTNILTKELYSRFKEASDGFQDPSQVSREFARLAKSLPTANYSVLYVLFKFLNEVIKNKDANKMNLRNLCIVFSPTLNIASDILVPFLVDFSCVFENGKPIGNQERDAVDLNIPTF